MLRPMRALRLLPLAVHLAATSALILAVGGAAHATIVIDNGLDCSDPANVIDYDTSDSVWVQDSLAGEPTQVCLVDGGAVGASGNLVIFDSSSVRMSGGTVEDAVTARNDSGFTMSGGEVPWGLYCQDYASVTMRGGLVGSTLWAGGESSLTIEDGTLTVSTIYARDSSTIILFGVNFEVDEAPVPYGDLSAPSGTLTGTLANGSSFYTVFYQGGASCGTGPCTGTITLAPPPDPEVCNDGVDNDGDGLADFDDPDCTLPRPFEYPVSEPTVSQGFDNIRYPPFCEPECYHTGLDLDGDSEIYPIGPGTVVRKQLNDVGCGPPPAVGDCEDRGLGNTLIIQHCSETIGAFYSLYAHLDSIDADVEVGTYVDESSTLGVMGGSGYGQPDYWPVYLHLETKTQPVLHNGWRTAWSYTLTSALDYIYLDPVPILETDAACPPLTQVPPGTGETSALGGSGVPGGVDVAFENTDGGILFAEFTSVPEEDLEQAAGVYPTSIYFVLPAGPVQVWTLEFSAAFSGPIDLTFGYANSTPRLAASTLVLYHLVGSTWVPLEGAVDEQAGTITVTTDGLSTFLLGTSQRVSLPALSSGGYLALISCLAGLGLVYMQRSP